jgi:hypothetical protein
MIVIGMTGPIGHGKSTFASALKELVPNTAHLESSLVIAEVANALHASTTEIPSRDDIPSINRWLHPLPAILLDRVKVKTTFDKIELKLDDILQHPVRYNKLFLHIENIGRNPDLLKQAITRENKETYRPILQWLGGYLVIHVDKGIWYTEIQRRIEQARREGKDLCIVGGLRFPTDAHYVRAAGGVIIKVYRPGHIQDAILDPTERDRDNIEVDSVIASNGTVEDLKRVAAQVYKDIQESQLQRNYRSAKA